MCPSQLAKHKHSTKTTKTHTTKTNTHTKPTPHHHNPLQNTEEAPAGVYRVRAMLASTIQKSNNQDQPAQDERSPLAAALMPQNPNSVFENPPPTAHPPSTHPTTPTGQQAAVLTGRPPTGGRSSTTPLANTTKPTGRTPAVTGVCSLERR